MFGRITASPGLRPYCIKVEDNDTIILKIDQKEFDMDEITDLVRTYNTAFPDNNIVITFNGIDIVGVIKNKGEING